MPFTYIFIDTNQKIYIGSTTDLERRLREHARGHTTTTRKLDHLRVLWHKEYLLLEDARTTERKIKSWKSRYMIEKLVNGSIQI